MIATLRNLAWTDFFLYILIDPRALYRHINKSDIKSFFISFIVPAVVVIFDIITISLLGQESPFFYYKITYGWILLYLLILLQIVIASSLMDLISQFLGYSGNIRDVISLVNFSLFPRLFLLPAVYIFKVFNFAPLFFYLFFSAGLLLWSMFIAVQGISEMHGISLGRAFFIFLFPCIFVGTVMIFIAVLLILSIFSYFSL